MINNNNYEKLTLGIINALPSLLFDGTRTIYFGTSSFTLTKIITETGYRVMIHYTKSNYLLSSINLSSDGIITNSDKGYAITVFGVSKVSHLYFVNGENITDEVRIWMKQKNITVPLTDKEKYEFTLRFS